MLIFQHFLKYGRDTKEVISTASFFNNKTGHIIQSSNNVEI
jgi:hypothetical protein